MTPEPAAGTAGMGVGRAFVHPVFDYAVIGGGLSLLTLALLYGTGTLGGDPFPRSLIPALLLIANASHFAATSVRLYTKPGAFQDLPFFTLSLPLVMLTVLTVAITFSQAVGMYFHGLYLTLSPFHYAAQTFGLATMYAIRSGRSLADGERRLLWATCLLPFGYAVVAGRNSGLGWSLPADLQGVLVAPEVVLLGRVLGVLVFAAPMALMATMWRRTGTTMPAISWLLVFTNGMWWVVFDYLHAFVWGAIFHSVQYLGIVLIFHVRDHRPAIRRAADWVAPALKFYGACLVLGYALFEVLPYAYVAAGFTLSESTLLCAAMINFHHFIVDRVIWRVRRDPNYRIVVAAQ